MSERSQRTVNEIQRDVTAADSSLEYAESSAKGIKDTVLVNKIGEARLAIREVNSYISSRREPKAPSKG